MKWICDEHIVTEEMIKNIEKKVGFKFPKDYLETIRLYDGGYPSPNRITIDGNQEIVNNLISFDEDDESYILDIIMDSENFDKTCFVPIAEDPFGNLFCYAFDRNRNIIFWNHENPSKVKFISRTFTEFLSLLH